MKQTYKTRGVCVSSFFLFLLILPLLWSCLLHRLNFYYFSLSSFFLDRFLVELILLILFFIFILLSWLFFAFLFLFVFHLLGLILAMLLYWFFFFFFGRRRIIMLSPLSFYFFFGCAASLCTWRHSKWGLWFRILLFLEHFNLRTAFFCLFWF